MLADGELADGGAVVGAEVCASHAASAATANQAIDRKRLGMALSLGRFGRGTYTEFGDARRE